MGIGTHDGYKFRLGQRRIQHFIGFCLHARFRNGTGFIHTQCIDAGQCFNAIEIPYKHTLLGQPQYGCRQCNGSQKIQAFRNHANQCSNSRLNGIAKAVVQGQILIAEQENANRHKHEADDHDQTVK